PATNTYKVPANFTFTVTTSAMDAGAGVLLCTVKVNGGAQALCGATTLPLGHSDVAVTAHDLLGHPTFWTATYDISIGKKFATKLSGYPGGGTTLNIAGTGFTEGTTVTFGANSPDAMTLASSKTLQVTAPAGTGDVTLEVAT